MAKTILFSNTNIIDYETLLAGLGSDDEVHLLNAEEDGVLQMAAILQGRSGFDSIEILSHGGSGSLFLGSSVLNNDNLAGYSEALSQIGSALSETGDLLLYGCNVAQGEAGVRFIDRLSHYTGADVAASDDLTGRGGDWLLEVANGQIEAALAVNETSQVQYAGTLAINSAPIFGTGDGMVIITDLGLGAGYSNTTLEDDGKILLAGGGHNGSNYVFALVRYNSNGSRDTGFDNDGIVTTAVGSGDSLGGGVAIQSDGKILVGGYSKNGSKFDFALVRYNNNGSLDTSFSGDGKVTTDLGGSDQGYSVSVQADGKILLSGHSDGRFAMVCYNSDGSLDGAFDAVNTLNGNPTYTENGAAVVLDSSVQIYDAELAAQGHYNGASITLARNGGANSDDLFSGSGNLS